MDRSRYPANWDAIATAIKAAAGWQCQNCGRICRQRGESWPNFCHRALLSIRANRYLYNLHAAHLDDNPANCDRTNLMALCQSCHARRDIQPGALERKRQIRLEELGQLRIF